MDHRSERGQVRGYDVDYGYEYPYGLNLRPGSEDHETILRNVLGIVDEAIQTMEPRAAQWREVERMLHVFVRPEEKSLEMAGDAITFRKETPKVGEVFVLPLSYLVRDTIVAQLTSALLSPPIFRYLGVGAEDRTKAKLLEAHVAFQSAKFKHFVELRKAIHDVVAFGISAIVPSWERVKGKVPRVYTRVGGPITGIEEEKYRRLVTTTLYEGTRLRAVDPLSMFVDPLGLNGQSDEASYFGFVVDVAHHVLDRYERNEDDWFNVKYVRDVGEYVPMTRRVGEVEMREWGTYRHNRDVAELIVVQLRTSLQELGVSDDDDTIRTYEIVIANRSVILRFRELEYPFDDKLQVLIVPGDVTTRIGVYPSRMEAMLELQAFVNEMLSLRKENLERAVVNAFIVNPSAVMLQDLINLKPGGLVRLKPDLIGTDPRMALQQIGVVDVSGNILNEVMMLMEVVKQATGSVDPLLGMAARRSDRVSATEARLAGIGGFTRIDSLVRLLNEVMIRPLGMTIAQMTQLYSEKDLTLSLLGSEARELQKIYGEEKTITPEDIVCEVDVLPVDNSVATREEAPLLQSMLEIVLGDQELRQVIDVPKLVMTYLKAIGVPYPTEFIKVMPDERVASEAEKGNLVPVETLTNVGNVQV